MTADATDASTGASADNRRGPVDLEQHFADVCGIVDLHTVHLSPGRNDLLRLVVNNTIAVLDAPPHELVDLWHRARDLYKFAGSILGKRRVRGVSYRALAPFEARWEVVVAYHRPYEPPRLVTIVSSDPQIQWELEQIHAGAFPKASL